MDVTGEISIETPREGIVVVALEGEHDLGTVAEVREALAEAGGRGGAVVVDLCPATFVDSSILGAILSARRSALEAGAGFGVACDGKAEPVRRVLEVTGLDAELPVHPSREAAVSSAQPAAADPT